MEVLTPSADLGHGRPMHRVEASRRGRRRARVVAALACALLLTGSASAQVPGEEIARRAFEEGVALEKKGDYAGALEKFTESEQIKATLGNRYHKAYCLEMTGKLAAALIEYEVVDKAAREGNKAEIIEATRVRLEPLRARVPQLSLKLAPSAPPDAEVSLDGVVMAPALLDGEAFRIDPGDHVITARAGGHEAFTKAINALESTAMSVEITLQREVEPDPVMAPPANVAPERSRALPIVTSAGAAALAVSGVVAYVLAGAAQDDLEKTCLTKPSCADDRSSTRTLDAIALGSWIGAAGLIGLSVALWTAEPASPRAAAKVVMRASWLGVEGRF